jgi:hypothetical protein
MSRIQHPEDRGQRTAPFSGIRPPSSVIRLPALLAYGWAFLAGPLLLATFLGMEPLTGKLVAVTGLHVHPIYTGGAEARTIEHGRYETHLHSPVFDGLIGQRSHGFIQIQWTPKDTNLPDRIEEPIDFDGDGTNDFMIRLDTRTNQASLETSDRRVLSIQEVVTVGDTRIVRVKLKRS